MKAYRSFLSFVLVLCMVMGLTWNVNLSSVMAEPVAASTEAAYEETLANESEPETEGSSEEPTESTESESTEASTEANLPVVASVLDDGIATAAVTTVDDLYAGRPANGQTSGQPFATGTGDSEKFRIPAMVTLNNGTIVAATDARWNTHVDGGGLDTIVSYSRDNGATWNYTFANYMGDNYNGSANVHNKSTSAFIDPVLATDGTNVYMLVDLFPAGYSLNTTCTTNVVQGVKAFNDQGKLLLSNNNYTSYDYYLDGTQIKTTAGAVVENVSVDAYFNITTASGVTNLFYADSPYKVAPTTYLYLTKSTDGGATWEAPTLISGVKGDSERFYGVGPGRGLVMNDGMIIFPCYVNPDERASFIFSQDSGASWKRVDNATTDQSSESVLVKLSEDRIRSFYRNGSSYICYTDYVWSEADGTWVITGNRKVETTFVKTQNNQLSAINLKDPINGKPAIAISTATGNGTSRAQGKIYVFTLDDSFNMSLVGDYTVTTGAFQYSCLSELGNGKIGILYEGFAAGTAAGETFASYTLQELAPNAGNLKDYTLATTLVDGEQYLIVNEQGRILTGTTVTAAEAGKPVDGLKNVTHSTTVGSEKITGAYDSYLWTANGSTDQWSFMIDGQYLNTSGTGNNQSVLLGTTAQNMTVTSLGSNKYSIKNSGSAYLDTFEATFTAAYKQTGSLNANERWYFYGPEVVVPGIILYNGNDCDAANLSMGGSTKLTMSDASTVTWQSNSTSVASVNAETGVVTALKVGTAEISAVAADGTVLDTITITVYNEEIKVQLDEQESVTYYIDQGNLNTSNLNTNIATVEIVDGYMTITGVSQGVTSFSVGNLTFQVYISSKDHAILTGTDCATNNRNQLLKTLIMTVGKDKVVEASGSAASVEWYYDDPAIVTVTESGTTATIHSNSVGETTVTAVYKDASGVTIATERIFVKVIDVQPIESDGTTTTRTVDIYIKEVTDSHLYYYQNQEGIYHEIFEGTMFWMTTEEAWALLFFAAPLNDDYGLNYMSAANNYNTSNWYAIEDNVPGNETSMYNGAEGLNNGHRRLDVYESSETAAIIAGSKDLMYPCDGGFWYSRTKDASGNVSATIIIISETLPKLTKKIISIKRSNGTVDPYREGMTVDIGDTINYEINIIEPARYNNNGTTIPDMIYSKAVLTDALTGNALYYSYDESDGTMSGSISQSDDMTAALGMSAVTNETVLSFYTKLQLTLDNYANVVDETGTITNTADLKFDFRSTYSTGAMTAAAEAKATIQMNYPNYVIDFGLPVKITDHAGKFGTATITKATCQYGNIEITPEGNAFIYTPKMVLPDKDFVRLTLSNGEQYGVYIYPATTVFYDENFAVQNGTDWTEVNKAPDSIGQQETALVGGVNASGNFNYGYDSIYENKDTAYASSTTIGANTNFEFRGTGVTIYTNNTNATGRMSVKIYNKATGKLVKLMTINTIMRDGHSAVTMNQEFNDKSFPSASVMDLPYDTYQVKINHIRLSSESEDPVKELRLDGFRIYNTLNHEVDETVYAKDSEADPYYINLRDCLLNAYQVSTVEAENSIYVGNDADGQKYYIEQVYDERNSGNTVTYVSGVSGNKLDIADLLDNGPKNQIYLRPGEGITCNLSGSFTSAWVGLKAMTPEGGTATSATITINDTQRSITNNTDMFYKVNIPTENAYMTIINPADSGIVLAVTDLKTIGAPASLPASTSSDQPSTDQPSVASETESVAMMARSIMLLSLEPEVEEPAAPLYADASLNISVLDWDGNILAETALTKSGEEGQSATFTADEIKAAATALTLPANFSLDGAKFYDVTTTYGATASFECYAEEVVVMADAVLTVKLVNVKGSTLASMKLTYTGEEGESHKFTKDQVKSAAQKLAKTAGYTLNKSNKYKAVTVRCGKTASVSYKVATTKSTKKK